MLESRSGLLEAHSKSAVSKEANEEVEMSPEGDRFMLCTDGLTEVFNAKGEMLGVGRIARNLEVAPREAAA